MEDRYLFKSKRLDNGKWVQGYLYGIWEKRYILWGMTNDVPNMIEVDPSTICQCTGLKDKNGNLIWENDVAFVTDEDGCSGQIDTGTGQIIFFEGLWYIDGRVQNGLYDIDKCFNIEVIGNIFDNSELLESEEQ